MYGQRSQVLLAVIAVPLREALASSGFFIEQMDLLSSLLLLLASCYGSCSRPDIFPMSAHFSGTSCTRPLVSLFFTGGAVGVHPKSETRN